MGKIIDFTQRRLARGPVGRLPLTVGTHQDAVSMLIPGFEWWLHPDQAEELAKDLARAAREARELARGPRPRGA